MRRETWKVFAAVVAVVALVTSTSALAAKKKTPTPAAAEASDTKADKTDKVNLNTADEKAIAGAKGVGAKLAAVLVKGRPYRTWDDVSKVKGVGSGKKLDALKGVLKLTEGVGAAAPKAEAPAEKKTKTSSKGSEAAPQPAAPAAGPGVATGAGSGASSSSPSKKSESSSSSSSSAKKTESAPKLAPGTKININTATKEELDALPEIGPVKAQAIVDYRKANGNFATPEDIMKVPGIKEGTFAKIKDYVVVR